jgi:hypothetical protein
MLSEPLMAGQTGMEKDQNAASEPLRPLAAWNLRPNRHLHALMAGSKVLTFAKTSVIVPALANRIWH